MNHLKTLHLSGAVATSAAREIGWGLAGVRRELHHWRTLAARIPDPVLRMAAVGSLHDKRYYTDGAALFWVLPRRRSSELLALLAAYQTIANYLDYASERGAARRGGCGESLMLALVDAVDVDGPVHDYYADHPWKDDGGYLRALVQRCRAACASLPRYDLARASLLREARRGRALELCHDPDPQRRDTALKRLAVDELGGVPGAAWFEVAGSATSLLGVIAVLALAADERTTAEDLEAALAVYVPWVGALSLMLDGYVDQVEDAVTGSWSAVAYYATPDVACERIAALMRTALDGVAGLRRGEWHTVVIAAMIAMYLTSADATAEPLAARTRVLRGAGGRLTSAFIPALQAWRTLYRQRR
jgi:tetraprenyl-beta-curcumene synthase